MKELVDTMRLSLRPFTLADVEDAFGWFGDPEVMRFTPTGPDRTHSQTRERIEQYNGHQVQHGFSKWLIQEKSSGKPIGDSGLLILDELGPTPDLGFRFAKPYWHQGFATEVATAWIRAGFAVLGLDLLTAFAHVDNLASLRVLEKVGFRKQKRQPVMGMDSFTYVVARSDFDIVCVEGLG